MAENSSLANILRRQVKQYETEAPAIAQAYEKIVLRLLDGEAGNDAPRVGDQLQPFLLPDNNGRLCRLADLLADGPLVVSLNRGHWCKFCQHELDSLQNISSEIRDLGGNVVAITPEKQKCATQLKIKRGLDYPILCDVDNAYALSLGLAVWCGEEIIRIYDEYHIKVAQYQNNPNWLLPIPATFVVARDGRIVGSFVNADFRYRMAPEDILSSLKTAV